jgi:hypothetical protein
LKIGYKSGKKEKFYYIKSGEFKKLKTLEPLFIKNQPSPLSERHFLCPRCTTPLLKNIFSCPNCHLAFKNVKDAIRLSLLFPGGGYFYTGHPILGVIDTITEGILLLGLIAHLLEALNRIESWGFALLFAAILSYEKWITIYHAKHYINEYIPIDKNFGLFSSNPAPELFSPARQSPIQERRERLALR